MFVFLLFSLNTAGVVAYEQKNKKNCNLKLELLIARAAEFSNWPCMNLRYLCYNVKMLDQSEISLQRCWKGRHFVCFLNVMAAGFSGISEQDTQVLPMKRKQKLSMI